MRLQHIAFLLSLFCTSAVAQNNRDQVMFMMPNADTCAKILPLEAVQERYRFIDEDVKKLREYGVVQGWLQGYVTAANAYHPNSNGDMAKNMNAKDLMNWVFSYCRTTPTATFFDIHNALVRALKFVQ